MRNYKKKWNENEEAWNDKFDLVVTERNSLKRKVKSLQTDLCDHINKNNEHGMNWNNNKNSMEQFEEEEEVKMDKKRNIELDKLKAQIAELKKSHNNEKTMLLNSIQRLSSKSTVHSKGSDLCFLVNSLSNLISEKEDIIESLTKSKKCLGEIVLKYESLHGKL